MTKTYLILVFFLFLLFMAYPFSNWLKVRSWNKSRLKKDAWLGEKLSAQAYLEAYPPKDNSKIHCFYCQSEKIHKRIEFSIPTQILLKVFNNVEVGISEYESYRCVSCATELYGNLRIKKQNTHSDTLQASNRSGIWLLFRELLFRLKIIFSTKCISRTSADTIHSLPQLSDLPLDRILNFSSPIFSGVENTDRLNQLLDEAKTLIGPGFYQGDNFFAWFRNNSALEDERFVAIFQENALNEFEKAILWRLYIQVCAASHCIHLNGDFVECGVSLGTEIRNIVSYLGGKKFPKIFWAYDDFDLDVDIPSELSEVIDRKKLVMQRLVEFPQVKIIPGPMMQSLEAGSKQAIAYLHLSLVDAKMELAALECLFDRVVPGGIILLNSYEWSGSHREHKKLEDQWLSKKCYRVFPLPTGQGLVIKR